MKFQNKKSRAPENFLSEVVAKLSISLFRAFNLDGGEKSEIFSILNVDKDIVMQYICYKIMFGGLDEIFTELKSVLSARDERIR